MNSKKYLSITIITLILAIPVVMSSCKKGDEDPFLSFRSRSSRVEGDWTVSKLTKDVVRKENNVNTKTVTTVEEGSWKQVISIIGTDSVRTLSGKITVEPNQEEGSFYYSFDKNGIAELVYKYEYDEDLSGEDDDVSTIINTKVTEEWSGTWNFLAGVDDYKNKERLAFVIEDRKITINTYEIISGDDDEGPAQLPRLISVEAQNDRYANGEMSTVFTINQLKNKEIKLHLDINTFYLRNEEGVGISWQDNGYQEMVLTPRK